MIKGLITILIVVGVVVGGYKLWEYWENVENEREKDKNPPAQLSPERLQGLPPKLEPSLQQAEKGGPKALKAWLDQYKRTGVVKDPRLAWIELDYVVMITKDDPIEAKKIFGEVKQRTPPDSPVNERIKTLEKNYE